MTKTLIDGERLQDLLAKRLVEAAEIVEEGQLSPVLDSILAMRQHTRLMIAAKDIPIDERDKILEGLEGMSEKYFLAVATLEIDELPIELAEILEIEQIVGEMIEDQNVVSKPVLRMLPGKKQRKKVNSELLTPADQRFDSVKPLLRQIQNGLHTETLDIQKEKGFGAVLNEEGWRGRLKFQPFIELAQKTDMTPEEWMDCEAARRHCADWLCKFFGMNDIQAASFYAHVTEKFRNRTNSMWQVYKERKLEECVQKGAGPSSVESEEIAPGQPDESRTSRPPICTE